MTLIVVGLYHTAGTAEDVSNRLRTEGVRPSAILVRRLRDFAPMPAMMEGEARGYAADPFFGSFILKKFGDPIPNGETAVCVTATSDESVDATADLMRQYVPVRIEVVSTEDVETFLAEEKRKPPPR